MTLNKEINYFLSFVNFSKAVKQRCSSDDLVEGKPNKGCRRCEL